MWLSRGGILRGELLHGFIQLSTMLDCQSLKTDEPRLVTFSPLIFRHRASSLLDRRFATLQRTLFIYLINKYLSLSDIFLKVHH